MARGRPKTYKTENLLNDAMLILWRDGVNNISLNQLADEIGVSKPALANSIGGKDDIIAKSLDHYAKIQRPKPDAVLAAGLDLHDLVRDYLLAFADLHTEADKPAGCLFVMASAACSAIREGPIRETIDNLQSENMTSLISALKKAGCDNPNDMALFISGQIAGMSALARGGAGRDDLHKFANRAAKIALA